jgi:hypothetical protein
MSVLSKFDADIVTRLAPPIEVLQDRAEARALLWHEYQIPDLPTAVDPLQSSAEQSGLVALIGQDKVQRLIAEPFARLRSADEKGTVAITDGEPDTFVSLSEAAADIMRTWELADV